MKDYRGYHSPRVDLELALYTAGAYLFVAFIGVAFGANMEMFDTWGISLVSMACLLVACGCGAFLDDLGDWLDDPYDRA